jgi:hypothetical protein
MADTRRRYGMSIMSICHNNGINKKKFNAIILAEAHRLFLDMNMDDLGIDNSSYRC